MKNFIKGVLSLSIMLLMAGIFTMVPSFVNMALKQTSQSQLEEQINESSADGDVAALRTDELNETIYNGLSVYVIETAADLSSVAYNVNNGVGEYASANYYLKKDIDLEASSWTPIGTAEHPFTGNFFGNDHTISNVHINNLTAPTNTDSGIGLFGTVNKGTISDLAVAGNFSYMIEGHDDKIATLVGNITDGELINVYDLTNSSYPSVGTNTGTKYFQGFAKGNGALSGIDIAGNVAIYSIIGDGKFYLADPDGQTLWRESTKVRVVLSTGNTEDSNLSINNPIYTTHIPKLRNDIITKISDVEATDKYVYPLLAGSQATIPAVTTNSGNVSKISFTTTKVDVYLNYDYGSRSDETYSLPYDTAFAELDAQYLNRVGYKLTSINDEKLDAIGLELDTNYNTKAKESLNLIYNKAYPVYSEDEGNNTFAWEAKTNNQFNQFTLNVCKDESDNSEDWDITYAEGKSPQVTGANKVTNGNGKYTHTSGTPVEITFTLPRGFAVAGVKRTTLLSGTHSDYYYYFKKGNNNITEDSYSPIEITVTNKTNDIYSAQEYTIKITNIVGQGGEYNICIKRVDFEIPLTFTVPAYGVSISDNEDDTFKITYWTSNSSSDSNAPAGAQTVEILQSGGSYTASEFIKLKAKKGEDPSLYLYVMIDEGSGGEILNAKATGFNLTTSGEGQTGKQTGKTYGLYRTEFPGKDDKCSLEIVVGKKLAKVKTEVYDEAGQQVDGTKLNADILLNDKKLNINSADNWIGVPTNGIELEFKNYENSDYGSINTFVLYEGSVAEDNKVNNITTPYDETNGFYILVITLKEKSYTLGNEDIGFALHEDINNLQGGTRYTLGGNPSFVEKLFDYSVKNGAKVIFDGKNFTDDSFKIGDTLTVTVKLTDIGKQIVYIPDTDSFVTPHDSSCTISYKNYNNGTWTFDIVVGKVQPKVNVNFAFKNISLTFDGVVNEAYEIVADAGFSVNGNSILTGKYHVDATNNNKVSLNFTNDNITSINLNTQYYLLRWYLQNGDTQGVDLTGQFGSYKEHNTFTSYTTANQASFDFTIKAIVGDRQIKVTYDAGEAGNGELVMADGSALANIVDGNKISYNTAYTVFTESQTFHNFGHNLQTWSFGTQQGTIANGTITLTGTNWSSYFGAKDKTSQEWSSFANDEDTDGYNNKEGSLLLTAVWSPISYNISFDGANRTVQVGDTITFTESATPGASGTYTITRGGEQVGNTISSASQKGYKAKDFDIIQSLKSEGTVPAGFQDKTSITLSVDNMKDILADNYYYAVNDANSLITVTTNKEPVRYKLYIADSSYYTVTFNMDSLLKVDETLGRELGGYEDNNGNGSFDEGDKAFIYIVYANPAKELEIALEKGYLTITRYGYNFNGTFKNFDITSDYALTIDSTLTPIFTIDEKETTALAGISFDEGIGNIRTFYLLNEKNIANGGLTYNKDNTSYSGESLSKDTTLPNGEKVTAFGFNLYKNGSSSAIILSSKNLLDLKDFVADNLLAGSYKVTFFVAVQDVMDNSHTKTFTSSSSIEFTIERNTVVLNKSSKIVSVFTNSTMFVAADGTNGNGQNNYGTFRLSVAWDGSTTSDNAQEISLSSFVDTTSTQIDGDYNVGTGKSISIGVSLNNLTNINNISIDGITNWNEMFRNVSASGSSYILELKNVAEIVKAIFTIDFGNASSYYFGSDGQTIVKENDAESISFIIGTKTFNYTYDKITYIGSQTNGTFTGTDMAVFNVSGISIGGFEDNWQDSFEYRLSGNFELIGMADAVRKAFEARYLTATNGKLASSLANTANGVSATISISNITYGGQIIGSGAISGEQIYGTVSELDGNYTYGESLTFKVGDTEGDTIVFSFTNNGSGQILFYANPTGLKALSFDLEVKLSGGNAKNFKLLNAWATNTSPAEYDNYFSNNYQNNSFKVNYSFTNHGTTLQNVFAVLSDVRKVTLNYNGGKNAENAGSETIYFSAGQKYSIANPSHSYSGLSFNGYQRTAGQASDPTLNLITAGEISDGYYLSASTGGVGATFAAKWKATDIDVDAVDDKTISFFASLAQTYLPLTDFIKESLYLEGGTFSYELSNDSNTFAYKDGQFIITDKANTTPSTLSGSYNLKITLSYTDDISGTSEISKTLTGYTLEIKKNVMAFDDREYKLTYNNNTQHAFTVGLTKNGEPAAQNLNLQNLLTAPASEYGITVAISGKGSTIKAAGDYTVTASIASGMENYFELGSKSSFTVNVAKYTLNLAEDYIDQIGFSKELGAADPAPLQTEITIAANNSERVLIAFDRETGETAGSYDLYLLTSSIVDSDDKNNYELVGSTTLADKFEIKVPQVSLQVQMTSALSYVYNGYALSDLTITFNQTDNSYTLTGSAGAGKSVSASFKLYYTSSGKQIAIPAEEGENYTKYLEFAISGSSKNVGSYSLSASLTTAAREAGWSIVELVTSDYNNLNITERSLVVTSFTSVFNQKTTLSFNNVAALDNFTFESGEDKGIVSGDVVSITVTIANAQAGTQTIDNMELDSASAANYQLTWSGITADITPSSESVTMSIDSATLNYGQILKSTNLSSIMALIPFTFSGQSAGAIDYKFLTVTGFTITNAKYSTGNYLNANDKGETWDVVFTVTSPNFTFGSEGENGSYTNTYTVKLTVNKIALTINNAPSTQIIKPYDGNATVLPQFVGQEVNHANGYYTASGLLSGDKIIIASANYAAATIGSYKLTLNYGNDDSANYTITNNVQGEIGSVTLTFKKDVDTYAFVEDDGQIIKNTGNFTEVYSGGDDSSKGIDSLIKSILNEDNFATRVGYKQKGWTWNYKGADEGADEGADIALDAQMSQPQKEAFLQAAVDAGASGLTLKVVWDIEKYDITFVVPSAVTLTQEDYDFKQAVLTDIPYWTTIENILATAAAGYIVTGISANNSNVTLQSSGINTRNASFTLTHITGDSEITLTESEMQFKITLQTNEPQGFTANIDSAGGGLTGGWSRNGNTFTRVVNYTQAQSDLPKLIMTVSNTYGFNGWLLGNETSTGTIWERIGGSGLTQSDTTTGFTFTATWTESPLTLTINIPNGNVAVYVNDAQQPISPEGDTNKYTVHYNDKIKIDVTSSDWYKFVGASIVGTQTEQVNGSQQTTGSFTIDVLSESKTITISTEEIVVTFNPSSLEETLYGTQVTDTLLKTSFTYSEMQNGSAPLTFESGIGVYSATAGTYHQTDWKYNSAAIGLSTTLVSFITANGGIPTQDKEYAISATWQGESYTISFDKGTPNLGEDASFEGETEPVTRTWTYGERISNMPVVSAAGQSYFWANISDVTETFANGYRFTLKAPDSSSPYSLTLQAQWSNDQYTLTTNIVGKSDKVISISVGEQSYTVETLPELTVIYGNSRTFTLTLSTGYMVDPEDTKITLDEYEEGSTPAMISVSGNSVTVSGIHGNIEIDISIKAKPHTFTMPNQGPHVTASVNSFDVSYDEDISTIFDGVNFTRGGYTISSIYEGNNLFATCSNGVWSFDEDYVTITDGKYIYTTDRDLTLSMGWTVKDENSRYYFSGTTTAEEGIYFNATSQLVAKTTFTLSESLTVGATLNNLDRVEDIYYMIGDKDNGTRVEFAEGFTLYYTNAINSTVCMVVELEDSLSKEGFTYKIYSTQDDLVVNQSEININGSNIQSYFTGSSVIVPSNGDDYSNGTLYYHDNSTVVSELTISRVELVAKDGQYNVGNNYQVKYYFTKGVNFNIANYTGLTEEGEYIVFTPAASDVSAQVVPSIITLKISGKAFENGSAQQVKTFNASMPDHASNFTINITSIYTKEAAVGSYDAFEDLTVDYTITRGEEQIDKANFTIVVNGSYQIVLSTLGYQLTLSAEEFNADSVTLTSRPDDILFTFTSFTHNAVSEIISESEFSYLDSDENLIFSISGNGTANPKVQIMKSEEVTFNISATLQDQILTWTIGDVTAEQALTLLQTLSSAVTKTKSFTLSESQSTLSLVVTKYKAISLSLGDRKGGGQTQGYVYIPVGESEVVALAEENKWLGFDFNGWTTTSNGVSITEGTTISVNESANILAASAVASWKLQVLEGTAGNVEREAKPAVGSKIDAIDFEDVVSNLNNFNEEEIKYLYAWRRAGSNSTLHDLKDGFTVPANIDSSGDYQIVVEASYGSYTPTTKTFSFHLTINKIDVGTVTVNGIEDLVYAKYDYIQDISITFSRDDMANCELEELLDKDNLYYYFTLSGQSTSEIKNAGDYTLTLNLSDKVFNAASFTQNIKVAEYTVTVNQSMLPQELTSKYFGTDDPKFEFTYTVNFTDKNTSEEITIGLVRESGQASREYSFTDISTQNDDNYEVVMAQEGLTFEILSSLGTLNINVTSPLAITYDKTTPSLTLAYDEERGVWTIKITENDSLSDIDLTMTDDSGNHALNSTLYKLALKNISILVGKDVVKAASYDKTYFTVQSGEGANYTKFNLTITLNITPRDITIDSVQKIFDRNADITTSTNIRFDNAISGDDITLTGKFASELVGTHALTDLELAGGDEANYNLVENEYSGSITPLSVTNASVTIGKLNFVYGDINKGMTLEEIKQLISSIEATFDTISGDIEKGYASVIGWSVSEDELSTAGYLNAGEMQELSFTISSKNFNFASDTTSEGVSTITLSVSIQMRVKEIDLSSLDIEKNYDETTALPYGFSENIDEYILSYGDIFDDVEIDIENSYYEDKEVGENKKVTIVLKGSDKDNYYPSNAQGTINEFAVTFKVVANQEDEALVSDGKFVDDGLEPNVTYTSFSIEYPTTLTAAQVLGKFVYPTRTGYRATGWMILTDNGYQALTEDNVLSILREVAFDADNITKSINIYTVWEIRTYTISVSGDNFDYDIQGDYNAEDKNIDYYSSAKILITGKRGYKYLGETTITGTLGSSDTGESGKSTTTISLNNIGSNISLQVKMSEINITIKIDTAIPQYTNRIDQESLSQTVSYFELEDMTAENLPKLLVTEGTYYLSDYSYLVNGVEKKLGEQNLLTVIDEMLTTLEEDMTATFKAVWTGERYQITFDPNGGTLEGDETIEVIYGSVFSEKFPVASLAGRSNIWLDSNEQEYKDGDIYHTIGQFNEEASIWTETLTAKWSNNTYNLTVVFDEKIDIVVNGKSISSGQQYQVTYSETTITLSVSAERGYNFVAEDKELNGQMTEEGSTISIYNLVADGTITINSTPAPNDLIYFTTKIDKVELGSTDPESGEITYAEIKENKIIAYTESTVILRFTATKGYELALTSAKLVGTSGKIATSLDENGRLIVTWSGFTTNETLTVTATAKTNYITFGDISQYYDTISFNGISYKVTGDSVPVTTDTKVEIRVTLKYGYDSATVTSSIEEKLISQDCLFNNSTKCYYLTATLDLINEDFSLTFTAKPREYNFVIAISEGQEAYGEILSESEQTVAFGRAIDLQAGLLDEGYIFVSWQWNGYDISFEQDGSYTLSAVDKERLESATEGKLYIYATFRERKVNISLTLSGNGEVAYSQGGEEKVLKGNTTHKFDIYLKVDLVIRFIPKEGYEVGKLVIDNQEVSLEDYSYDEQTNTVTLPIDVKTPLQSIEIEFVASDACITVQAGVMVNYQTTYGILDGGSILLSDREGNLLDESLYLENNGNLVIGADYRYISKTDNIIYFIIEEKEGYDLSLNVTGMQEGSNHGEIEVNGKSIHYVTGMKDGGSITATFIALANVIDVYFVTAEDPTSSVEGGTIIGDTSSPLVQINGNNTSHIRATVTTGANLSITINSGISYRLVADENGYLKYALSSNLHDGVITAGLVEEANILQTGYSNISKLELSHVDGNTTIYIYVEPKVYNLRFYVNANNQVTVENAIIYGEEIDLSLLTDEQRASIFPKREGYTLGGYYTIQYGQGIQYIDRFGEVTTTWKETGYYWNKNSYEVERNFFDPETQTFTLYAAWELNKSSVTITFMPDGFETNPNIAGISDVIVNISPADEILWYDQNNKWYAQVSAGVSLTLKAYEFEGYEFRYWSVFKDGQSQGNKASQFNMSFAQGDYIIEAVYYPLFSVVSNGVGGTTALLQDGQVVTSASYDPNKIVTLQATAAYGYNFLYWKDQTNGKIIEGVFDEASGNYYYTYPQIISTPLDLVAVFEGKEVLVTFNSESLQENNELTVTLDGNTVDITQPFEARVGQTIVVKVKKSLGYTFEFIGGEAKHSEDKEYSIYTYVIDFKDVVITEKGNTLALTLRGTPEEITLIFIYDIDDVPGNDDKSAVGTLTFINANGEQSVITQENNSFKILFGQTVTLSIAASSYYKVDDITMFDGMLYPNFTNYFKNGKLSITPEMIINWFNYELTFEIKFVRVLWIDQEERILEGEGTADNPYLINSEEEMAYVAYLVNEGIKNEEDKLYSECVYELTTNLDFNGKYWVPIGTKENPFNGVMYLKDYNISNILHYTTYDPTTSYGGLFWILGDKVKIVQEDNTLVIILSVVGGLIFLILLILLIILLIRKKKKKEMEEIANG